MTANTIRPRWEHFDHDADIGIRGTAATPDQAFEQAAFAMMALITDPATVTGSRSVPICCRESDLELLFLDWINELIYHMSAHHLIFSRFEVSIDRGQLTATAFGEIIDPQKHRPAVEIKGATFTELRVYQGPDGMWTAQCVVDV